MVRTYGAMLELKKPSIEKECRDITNDKHNEALQSIQERGGVILNCFPTIEGTRFFKCFVIYEDNGNFDEINTYLKDVVFALDKI